MLLRLFASLATNVKVQAFGFRIIEDVSISNAWFNAFVKLIG